MPDRAPHHFAVVGRQRRRLVCAARIGDAQAAAEVEPADVVPVGAQREGQLGDLAVGRGEGLQRGELRADVDVDADDLDSGHAARGGVYRARAGDRHAELVLAAPGGDLVVGARVDVRVDAQRDRRAQAEPARHLVQRGELGLALDVDLPDPALERDAHLVPRLAHAGEDDALPRHPRGAGPRVLAGADHVHAGAEIRQDPQHREVRVRLDREADQPLRRPGQRLVEHPEVPAQRGRRIEVERGAHRRRDLGDRHLLGVQDAAAVEEMVHP